MSTKWAKTFRTQIFQSQFIHEELKKLSDPAAAVLFGSKVILFIVWRNGEHKSQISFFRKVHFCRFNQNQEEKFGLFVLFELNSNWEVWVKSVTTVVKWPLLAFCSNFPKSVLAWELKLSFCPFFEEKKSNHFSHMFLIKRLSSLSSWRARDFFNNFIQKGTFLWHFLWISAYPDAIPKH